MAAAVFVLFLNVGSAQASMDLVLDNTPDIMAGLIRLSYGDPGQDLLKADGYAMRLKDNSGASRNIQRSAGLPNIPGAFTLRANINPAGELQPGGTVSFSGVIPALGYQSGTILTGNLTALGFGAAAQPLEFLFEITGGDAAGLFGGVSSIAGLILNTRAFPGDFSRPFSNNTATADAGHVVPEPAAIVIWPLLVAGAAVLGWRRRRRAG